jgi:putative transcriptional regulator
MSYTPIPVNREALTIMDVPFPDLPTLDSAANAIGSNMFEGFVPTPKTVRILRDYLSGEITFPQLLRIAHEKTYE